MVLLLLLTAISLTSLKAIKTDERLSGNLEDRYLAFQAAEAGLRDAEDFLKRRPLPTFSDAAGLYVFRHKVTPEPFSLTTSNARHFGQDLASPIELDGVAADPLYAIEELEISADQDSLLTETYNQPQERGITYRITSLGFGGSPSTRVVLQSTFFQRQL